MICGRCHADKPASEYAPSMLARGSGYCRQCRRAYYRDYAGNPEKRAARKRRARERLRTDPDRSAAHSLRVRNKDYRRRYGITVAEYESRLAAQGGRCACCGTDDSRNPRGNTFHVDHDHGTGLVRGLICSPCNKGIGLLGDTAEGVAKALAYLQSRGAGRRIHTVAGEEPATLQ